MCNSNSVEKKNDLTDGITSMVWQQYKNSVFNFLPSNEY